MSFKTALERRGGKGETEFFFKNLFLSPCSIFCTQGHSLQPPSGQTEQKTVFITRRPWPLCPERKSARVCVCVCKVGLPLPLNPECVCMCVSPVVTFMVVLSAEGKITRQ